MHVKKVKLQEQKTDWIEHIQRKIENNKLLDLIKDGGDPEVSLYLSDFDRDHALKKARIVAASLQVLYNAHQSNVPTTWLQACAEGARRCPTRGRWCQSG